MRNATANVLANVAARMSLLRDDFSIEILYKLPVPDNITNLRAFDDDQQILYFMANADVFKDTTIDKDGHERHCRM